MTKEELERKRVEAYKALECIFVAVQDSVARDLNYKVRAYINAIVQERDVLEAKVKARDNELDLLHENFEENKRLLEQRDALERKMITLQQDVGDAIMERNAYMREVAELKEAASKPPRQKKQP